MTVTKCSWYVILIYVIHYTTNQPYWAANLKMVANMAYITIALIYVLYHSYRSRLHHFRKRIKCWKTNNSKETPEHYLLLVYQKLYFAIYHPHNNVVKLALISLTLSLAIRLHHPLFPAGLLDYILCPYRASLKQFSFIIYRRSSSLIKWSQIPWRNIQIRQSPWGFSRNAF